MMLVVVVLSPCGAAGPLPALADARLNWQTLVINPPESPTGQSLKKKTIPLRCGRQNLAAEQTRSFSFFIATRIDCQCTSRGRKRQGHAKGTGTQWDGIWRAWGWQWEGKGMARVS